MPPRVTVLLPTRDRPTLLAVALRCYAEQDYPNRELLVLDDGADHPVDPAAVAAVGGRLIQFDSSMLLGAKLQAGATAASGDLLVKWDDDDYLGPRFLSAHVAPFLLHRLGAAAPLVVAANQFRVFIVRTGEIWWRQRDTLAGLFCVPRAIWEKHPFPEIAGSGTDTRFLAALTAAGVEQRGIDGRQHLVVVRRDGLPNTPPHTHQGRDGETYEQRLRRNHRLEPALRPESVLPDWALATYRALQQPAADPIPGAVIPRVTVLMPTRDRPDLLRMALRCYAEQRYAARDLLVLDDSADPATVPGDAIAAAGGRLLRFPPGTRLGAKLNAGAAASSGDVLAKMDDDDWFAPAWLEAHVAALATPGPGINPRRIAGGNRFPVLLLREGRVIDRIHPSICGNFVLPRAVWEQTHFPEIDGNGTDSSYLTAIRRRGVRFAPVDARELMVVLRRDGIPGTAPHTYATRDGLPVADAYAATFAIDPRPLADLLPPWALETLATLRGAAFPGDAPL